MAALGKALSLIMPKGRAKPSAVTPTYNPQAPDRVLTVPGYREHLADLYTNRQAKTSQELMEELFVSDPDTSATVSSYLTLAGTEPIVIVRTLEGQVDPEGFPLVQQIISKMGRRLDYTQGFQMRPSLRTIATEMRYMVLLRGGIGAELVVDKQLIPDSINHVDLAQVRWYERQPGVLKPVQVINGNETSLDVPTFYTAWYRRSPRKIYPQPPFVSAINTIAARTQVINDLYRIMNVTGYPRIDVSVLEEVLRKNAPPSYRQDEAKMQNFISSQINNIQAQFAAIRPDQAFVHSNAVEAKVINDKSPAMGLNVEAIIKVLNAQNQAGLKTVATVLGRGETGVNTATVEARIFSMAADSINEPVDEILSGILSMALQLTGRPSVVEVRHRPAEMRPKTELEPMMTVKQNRLLDALSIGVITDEEFHMEMFGRPMPPGSPMLSGTRFREAVPTDGGISPNSDPLGRSVSPAGTEAARSNGTRAGG